MKKQIFEKYRPLGFLWGSELLLKHKQAVHFINDCERMSLVIVGMDFFKKEEDGIVPLLNTADYSSISQSADAVQRSIAAARKLLKDGLPDNATWVSFDIKKGKWAV